MKKKLLLIALIGLISLNSCKKEEGQEKQVLKETNFSESKQTLIAELKKFQNFEQDKLAESNNLVQNSIIDNYDPRDYFVDEYGNKAGVMYDDIQNSFSNQIISDEDLYFDNMTPNQLSQAFKEEFSNLLDFSDVYLDKNISLNVENKLNELSNQLSNVAKSKLDEVIFSDADYVIQNEAYYIENLRNDLNQKFVNFNNSIGRGFELTPEQQIQVLSSSFMAQESIKEDPYSRINDLENRLNRNNLEVAKVNNLKVNGIFKKIGKVLKSVAKVVIVLAVSAAIIAATAGVGAIVGSLVSTIVFNGVVVTGATAGALIGGIIGAHYVTGKRYENSRFVNWGFENQ